MKHTQEGHTRNATALKTGGFSFLCKTVFTEAVLMVLSKKIIVIIDRDIRFVNMTGDLKNYKFKL